MKKRLRFLLLLVLLVGLLTVSAVADDTITAAGFYNIGTAANVTVTPGAASGTVEKTTAEVDSTKEGYETFYANSDKLDVTVTTTEGSQYLVLLVTGDKLPTAANTICYIDQKQAEDTSTAFSVLPKLQNASGVMTLYVTSNAADFTTISVPLGYAVSGEYEKQPYVLGDVYEDGKINVSDALLTLQIAGELIEASETQKLAADVDKNSKINIADALTILQYAGQLIDSF